MPTDVIIKILTELDLLKWRLSALENRLDTLDKMLVEKVGVPATAQGEAGAEVVEDEMERKTHHAMSLIVAIRQARFAIYGYTRLIRTMGLPANVDEMIAKVDHAIAMMFRLHQAILYAEAALTALELGHPYIAAFKFAVAGGIMALAVIQGSRTVGG